MKELTFVSVSLSQELSLDIEQIILLIYSRVFFVTIRKNNMTKPSRSAASLESALLYGQLDLSSGTMESNRGSTEIQSSPPMSPAERRSRICSIIDQALALSSTHNSGFHESRTLSGDQDDDDGIREPTRS